MPSRAQKRWSPRLRTGGALCLLGGAVGVVDQMIWMGDPVLGPSPAVLPMLVVISICGGIAFWLGRVWK